MNNFEIALKMLQEGRDYFECIALLTGGYQHEIHEPVLRQEQSVLPRRIHRRVP
jgi:hypothetical protein